VQDLRAVLHHEAAGAGDRPRPLDLLRHRGGRAPRPHRGRVRNRRRIQLQGVSPARMKILVVEDDKTAGQYVKRGWVAAGYHTDLGGEGEDGRRRGTGGNYYGT